MENKGVIKVCAEAGADEVMFGFMLGNLQLALAHAGKQHRQQLLDSLQRFRGNNLALPPMQPPLAPDDATAANTAYRAQLDKRVNAVVEMLVNFPEPSAKF